MWTGYGLASFNLLLDIAPEKARPEANALFQLVVAGSATVAPVVGGHLADAIGYRPIFILSAADTPAGRPGVSVVGCAASRATG